MQTFGEFWNDVSKYKLETKYEYPELKIGFQYANGCGAKGGIKFPGTMWGLKIISACIIHDIEWALSKSYEDLLTANRNFKKNLLKIIKAGSLFLLWPVRRLRVLWYTMGVELVGTKSYAVERGFINA